MEIEEVQDLDSPPKSGLEKTRKKLRRGGKLLSACGILFVLLGVILFYEADLDSSSTPTPALGHAIVFVIGFVLMAMGGHQHGMVTYAKRDLTGAWIRGNGVLTVVFGCVFFAVSIIWFLGAWTIFQPRSFEGGAFILATLAMMVVAVRTVTWGFRLALLMLQLD